MKATVTIVLSGDVLDVSWNPRLGPPRERSGRIGIGRDRMKGMTPDQRLPITVDRHGRVVIGEASTRVNDEASQNLDDRSDTGFQISDEADFPSFWSFMEHLVIPMQRRNPTHGRLDGRTTGGNRTVAGTFWRRGRQWKVHADTHYEPLLIAYEAQTSGERDDPFVEVPTARGGAACLELSSDLRAKAPTGPKHLYIYEIKHVA